ncbi:hypothetical protein [Sporolactobacillus sp. THM19-2]|nr:hypothetical protein [Sporolactobacillus sp. THM19-2]
MKLSCAIKGKLKSHRDLAGQITLRLLWRVFTGRPVTDPVLSHTLKKI